MHRSLVAFLVMLGSSAFSALHTLDRTLPGSGSLDQPQVAACGAGRSWTVNSRPVTAIGELEGNPAYLFNGIVAVRELDNGSIMIANAQPPELRFFSSQGRYLFSAGRKGRGPGEFTALGSVTRIAGDSILANDLLGGRLSLFSPDGRFVRNVGAQIGTGRVVRMHHLMHSKVVLLTSPVRAPAIGNARDSLSVFIHDVTAGNTIGIGTFPGMETSSERTERGIRSHKIAFPLGLSSAAGAGKLYLALTEKREIFAYDTAGKMVGRFGGGELGALVTSRDVERYMQAFPGSDTTHQGRVRSPHAGQIRTIYSKRLPALGELFVDSKGNLWVEHYLPPGNREPARRWLVYDQRGSTLCNAVTPNGYRVLDIAFDHVLVLHHDDFDVGRVLKLPIRK